MAGSYCRYCGQRCFVYRRVPDGSWAGHMATCADGMARDRTVLGFDHTTAINPRAEGTNPGSWRPSEVPMGFEGWSEYAYDNSEEHP